MTWRSTAVVALSVGVVAFLAGRGFSQDAKNPPKPPSPEEMQKAMAEMAAPAEQNKAIAAEAGTWDAETSMWMDPSAPPMKSKGVSTVKAVCNGLYTTDEYEGDFMGQKFTGLGIHGYNKMTKKYFGVWCDSLSTTPEVMTGTADATGKVITFDGAEMDCPMGKFTPRWIVKHEDADHTTFEHWSKYAAMGDEYHKEIEIKYTRHRGVK